jgi:hypothetical protein
VTSRQDKAAAWRKSTHSDVDGNGNCVEVALTGDSVGVRDSKSPAGGILEFPPAAWGPLLTALG